MKARRCTVRWGGGVLLGALLATCLVLAGGPHAEGADVALSSDAEAVLRAFTTKDAALMRRLAAERWRDPWRLVDELLGARRADAARRFAADVPSEDAQALRAYAAKPPAVTPLLRTALHHAEAAFVAGDAEGALLHLKKVPLAGNSFTAVRAVLVRAHALRETGRDDEAKAAYADATQRGRRLGWSPEEDLLALGEYSERLDQAERFHELLGVRRRILRLVELLGDAQDVVEAGADVGATLIELARAQESLPHLRRAHVAFGQGKGLEAQWRRARVDVLLCMALTLAGEFPDALTHGERARDVFVELDVPEDVAYACRELGNAYAGCGDVHHALQQYDRGLRALAGPIRAAEQSGEGVDPALLEERLYLRLARGTAHQESGRLEEAQEDLAAVQASLGESASLRMRAVTNLHLGEIAEKRADWPAAIAAHSQALKAATGDRELECFALVRLADAHARRGGAASKAARDQAVATYRRALELARILAHDELTALARLGLGEVHLARGEAKKALECARKGVGRLEAMTRGLATSEEVRGRGQADRARLFALGRRAAVLAGDRPALQEMLERSRARVLLASLGGAARVHGHVLPAGLRRQENEARGRFAAALERYRTLRGKRSAKRKARSEVEGARTALIEVGRRIEREHARVSTATQKEPVALDALRKQLAPDEAYVAYALDHPASHALVVAHEGARIVELKDGGILTAKANALLEDLINDESKGWQRRVDELREHVLAPLRLPKTVKRVLISPEGALSRLPWPMLVDPAATGARSVALVPSAGVWAGTRASVKRTGRTRVALGHPVYQGPRAKTAMAVFLRGRPLLALPETRKEVKAITGADDVRLLQQDATEERLRTAVSGRKRLESIHLACHGLLDKKEPFLSALALTPTDASDGFLTALEVFTLRLNTDLVVLSACNTGRGSDLPGEGLVGLSGAFLAAGAPRVIVSLWKVPDDETRKLMIRFYEEWKRPGTSTAAALRRAQAYVQKTSPHPYDWGAWVLWGHPQ